MRDYSHIHSRKSTLALSGEGTSITTTALSGDIVFVVPSSGSIQRGFLCLNGLKDCSDGNQNGMT